MKPLFTTRILKVCGHDVVEAKSGEEALRKLNGSESEIVLFLIDEVMPGISGGELATMLEARNPDLKVVYMSG